jgi:hypothetical protein
MADKSTNFFCLETKETKVQDLELFAKIKINPKIPKTCITRNLFFGSILYRASNSGNLLTD